MCALIKSSHRGSAGAQQPNVEHAAAKRSARGEHAESTRRARESTEAHAMTTGEPMISAGRRPATSRHIGRRWLWTRSAIDYGACRTSPTSSVSRPERSTAGAAAASDPAHAESAGTCATRSRKSGPGSSARAMLSHRAHATTGLPSAIDSFGAINDDTCARSARLSTAQRREWLSRPFHAGHQPSDSSTSAARVLATCRPRYTSVVIDGLA